MNNSTPLTFRQRERKLRFNYFMFLPKALRPLALWASLTCVGHWLVVGLSLPGLQPVVPLFYSLSSEHQLVDKWWLVVVPSLATLILLLHLVISKALREDRQHIVEMLLQITLFLQVLAFVISGRIIWIV